MIPITYLKPDQTLRMLRRAFRVVERLTLGYPRGVATGMEALLGESFDAFNS